MTAKHALALLKQTSRAGKLAIQSERRLASQAMKQQCLAIRAMHTAVSEAEERVFTG